MWLSDDVACACMSLSLFRSWLANHFHWIPSEKHVNRSMEVDTGQRNFNVSMVHNNNDNGNDSGYSSNAENVKNLDMDTRQKKKERKRSKSNVPIQLTTIQLEYFRCVRLKWMLLVEFVS